MTPHNTETASNACSVAENITINPDYRLELAVTKPQDIRPAIENIRVEYAERFGNVAVATTGRIMAIVPVEVEGKVAACHVSPEALKASRSVKAGKGKIAVNGDLRLANGQTFRLPEPVTYPNWQAVVPKFDKITFSIALNPQLLLDLAKAIGAGDYGVRLDFTDGRSPVKVTKNSAENTGELGVLMPMRLV